jgi:hypothetical protein
VTTYVKLKVGNETRTIPVGGTFTIDVPLAVGDEWLTGWTEAEVVAAWVEPRETTMREELGRSIGPEVVDHVLSVVRKHVDRLDRDAVTSIQPMWLKREDVLRLLGGSDE